MNNWTGLDIRQKPLQSIDVLGISNDIPISSPNVVISLLGKGIVETLTIMALSGCLNLGSASVFPDDNLWLQVYRVYINPQKN